MDCYFITGSSSGIGKALAEKLLQNDNNLVTGISRTSSISHKNYRHFHLDLSLPEKVMQFSLEIPDNAKKLVLINNAGVISQIKRVGTMEPEKIIAEYNVNLVSPAILTNSFMKIFRDHDGEKIIMNISSGAGKNPIDAWGVYCSSKAGIDMLSKVIAEEQKIHKTGFKIYSVAPGIVDTAMQKCIREANKEDFSRKSDFVDYKASGQLSDSNLVAEKLLLILASQNSFLETIVSVKDF